MILLELFITFLIIGLFTFGGGYSMIALIQSAVVEEHGWLTAQEFADILAISQITPGPVGINTATYAGYSAVLAEGYPTAVAVAGALIASLAVLILPMTLILIIGRWLLAHKDQAPFSRLFPILRLTVVGLIAAAALQLAPDAFANASSGPTLTILDTDISIVSLLIFFVVFTLSVLRKKKVSIFNFQFSLPKSPITLILLSALVGLIIY
jgi:chromate transporter